MDVVVLGGGRGGAVGEDVDGGNGGGLQAEKENKPINVRMLFICQPMNA